MGSIFKAPKIAAPEPIEMPSTDDVPDVEDEEVRKAEEEAQKKKEK